MAPAALAAIPSAVVGSLGMVLIRRSFMALSDPPTLMYTQVLKLVLGVLGCNTRNILDDVLTLEALACSAYFSHCQSSLCFATEDQIKCLFDSNKTPHSPFALYHKANHSSRTHLIHLCILIGRFSYLREYLRNELMLAFVGPPGAGTSSCINAVFGLGGSPEPGNTTRFFRVDPPVSTATTPLDEHMPQLHLGVAELESARCTPELLDRVGVTDTGTIIVCVFAANDSSSRLAAIMQSIMAKEVEYLVLINKCDTLGSDWEDREAEHREHFASVLGAPADRIFFTCLLSPHRVDALRCILFAHLRNFVKVSRQALLALMLLHAETTAELRGAVPAPDATIWAATGEAVANLLRAYMRVSVANIHKVMQRLAGDSVQRVSSLPHRSSMLLQGADGIKALIVSILLETSLKYSSCAFVADLILHCYDQPLPASAAEHSIADTLIRAREICSKITARQDTRIIKDLVIVLLQLAMLVKEQYPALRARGFSDAALIEFFEVALGLPDFATLPTEMLAEMVSSQIASKAPRDTATTIVATTLVESMPLLHGQAAISLLRCSTMIRSLVVSQTRSPSALYPGFSSSMPLAQRRTLFIARANTAQYRSQASNRVTISTEEGQFVGSLLKAANDLQPLELRGQLSFELSGDGAIDAKGVTRGVFSRLGQELAAGHFPFMAPVESGDVFFSPFKTAKDVRPADALRGLGRLIGLAICNTDHGVVIPASLPLAIFKLILGNTICLDDLPSADVARSVRQLCHLPDSDIDDLALTFEVTGEDGVAHPIIENGSGLAVTSLNRFLYLESLVLYYLGASLPLDELVRGVADVVSPELLTVFSPAMLKVVVCGTMDFSIDEFRASASIDIPTDNAEWFWSILAEMSPEEKSMLLMFITGSSAVPAGGFASLPRPIALVRSNRPANSFPVTHTCFNIMEVPLYTSRETMRRNLLFAVHNCGATDYGNA